MSNATLGVMFRLINSGVFQYGCSNLQASTVSNDSLIRWVRLTCPNGTPAVRMFPNAYCGVYENPCTKVIPTYTSPRAFSDCTLWTTPIRRARIIHIPLLDIS